MTRTMPFVQTGPYPFQNGGLPAMTSGYGRTIPAAAAQSAAAVHQGMAAYKTNQPGLLFAQQQAQQQQAVKDAKGLLFQMPSVRGGSAKPTPQEQAVVESAMDIDSLPPVEDMSYMYTDSKPVDMPQLEMVGMDKPKKISPMTYAIGAAALLLGGLYFLRN